MNLRRLLAAWCGSLVVGSAIVLLAHLNRPQGARVDLEGLIVIVAYTMLLAPVAAHVHTVILRRHSSGIAVAVATLTIFVFPLGLVLFLAISRGKAVP
jgi:hypothetical protein